MSQDDLTEKDLALLQDEIERYEKCFERIQGQFKSKTNELSDDEVLARQLTAELVATRRDEEKQFLQSAESVAHSLAHLRFKQANALSDLVKQPYFARVIYNEKNRDVEFKLGVASFPEERIIDWRKAPISKLYYDYEEGDDYEDEIAGVEREGHIKLKRAYRGKFDELSQVELKNVSYIKNKGEWRKFKKQAQTAFSLKDKEKIRELLKSHTAISPEQLAQDDGYLSQILSLLSPEQFRLISSDLAKPVIIQGSAGTGKTTVALHRLAWLLFEGNSKAKVENTLVVMFNPTLANYVDKILPSLGVHGVKIVTYVDWARDIVRSVSKITYHYRNMDVNVDVARFKSDLKTVEKLQSFAKDFSNPNPQDILEAFYKARIADPNTLFPVRNYLKDQIAKMFFDVHDLAFLLQLIYDRDGCYNSRAYPARLDHLLIDEAQDFTIPELKTLLYALEDKNQLTIAGDLGQKILENRDFGTWSELLEKLGLIGVDVLNLSIAYRSTYQIYEIAEHTRDPNVSDEDLKMFPKFGPDPKLTVCHNFTEAVDMTRLWIEDIININQKVIGAVICRTPQEARLVFETLLKQGLHGIRHGDAQHFEFTPGITITDVKQVKGLEFQCLLVFNPTEKNYPATSLQDRNLLYVAVTRAVYKLDFVSEQTPSSMLPEFIDTNDLTAVVEEDVDPNQFLFSEEAAEMERAGGQSPQVKKRAEDDSEEDGDMLSELESGEDIDSDDHDSFDDDDTGGGRGEDDDEGGDEYE